ncbi:NSFL1 cofactor p47-like [Ornithodoros turicata]|uniref:NSFL1 cofactor p47-like n=1 Tax=Ornithodoros turicata TaxID=34597 RepID=UPI003139B9BD
MADNPEHSDRVAQFCGVTGIDSSRAKFYLESAGWNLELALASFYEDKDHAPQREASPVQEESPRTSPGPVRNTVRRLAGIADLAKEQSNEEEGQAFYAGGSERSGQQVLGPGKKEVNFVGELFKAAKMHGAQVVDPSDSLPGATRRATFQGKGYRLGSAPDDAQVTVEPASHPAQGTPTTMTLKMWSNGFSIDDGPLRHYDDVASRDFLQSIQRGEIPHELLMRATGEVNLNMEDHRHEDYIAPRRRVTAFEGEGHRLGTVLPGVVQKPPSTSEPGGEDAARKAVPLDASQPSTSIQIRLADGSRIVAKLNDTHTIADVRNYIVAARPEYAGSTFVLLTTFPHKELEDEKASLKDANLLNAVIVQRLNCRE